MEKVKILDLQIFVNEDMSITVQANAHGNTDYLVKEFTESYIDFVYADYSSFLESGGLNDL